MIMRLRRTVWLAGLLVSAGALSGQTPTPWTAKVDPWVLEKTARADAEFLVILQEQADLTGAARLATKSAKAWFVYLTLRDLAERTQPPLLAELDRHRAEVRPFWIANMVWVRGSHATVEAVARRPEVRRVAANPRVQRGPEPAPGPLAITTVESSLGQIRATNVWALGYTGQNVTVAGQDTGYQWNHPALLAQYRGFDGTTTNHNYNWHDAIHSNDVHNTGTNPCGYSLPAPCDDNSHGTHTMGTMVGDDGAGNQIGVAPGARWIGCRNMERGWGTPATYAECFQWFLAPTDLDDQNPDPDRAPDVINNSWGCPPSEGCTDPAILQSIVENTRAAGIVIVVSAGNSGPSCATVQDPPAIYAAAFSVGATDNSTNIASFSSRGPVTVDGSNRLKPDISAPGVSIRSAVPVNGYGTKSGTSMAGPHVAGMVALVLSAHPSLRGQPDKIETLLKQTALPRSSGETCEGLPGTLRPNHTFGWGQADALAALAMDDTDADGIPDWWEITEGLDRTTPADSEFDLDGDGFTNLQEFLAGTDPHDAASAFRIVDVTSAGAVTFTTVSNKLYRLERASHLASNDWITVTNQLTGTGVPLTVTDPAAGLPAAFYRLRLLP
jgi:subtilisin family serine protease